MRKLINVAVLSCKATTYKYCKYDCHVLQEEYSTKSTISLRIQDASCLWFRPNEAPKDQGQPSCLKSRFSVAYAFDSMKPTKTKGNHHATKAGIQLPPPWPQWSSPRSKATIVPQKQEFSCLRRGPDETCQAQRQPFYPRNRNPVASAFDSMKLAKLKGNHHAIKAGIQLPLPLTRWNSPRPKATIVPQKQEFSCLYHRHDETHQAQRQPSCH